jgi:hypothetical protein
MARGVQERASEGSSPKTPDTPRQNDLKTGPERNGANVLVEAERPGSV